MSRIPGIALVADDNPVNRRLGSMLCRRAGIEAVEVASGLEALIASERIRFSFALLDVQMANLGGQAVLQSLRSHRDFGSMKLIAYTGCERLVEDGEYRFDSVLRKPADYVSFCQALRSAGVRGAFG